MRTGSIFGTQIFNDLTHSTDTAEQLNYQGERMQFLSHWIDNSHNALLITSCFSRREKGQEFPQSCPNYNGSYDFLQLLLYALVPPAKELISSWKRKQEQVISILTSSATVQTHEVLEYVSAGMI